MSSYSSYDLVKEVQLKKKSRQVKAILQDIYSDSVILRIEKSLQAPSKEAIDALLDEYGIPMDDFFCPFLVNQAIEAVIMRENLLRCLVEIDEPGAYANAKKLLDEFGKMSGFEKGINRQFIISCQARVYVFEKRGCAEVAKIIREGIRITFPEFKEDNFSHMALVFEESELIHTLARVYRRDGKVREAVQLCEGVIQGINALPEDDREKEQMLSKVLLTLSACLITQKEYQAALDTCEEGLKNTIKRSNGKYASAFAYNKAVCLFRLGKKDESEYAYKLAYFGSALMRKRLLREDISGVNFEELFHFNTYGVEKFDFAPHELGQALYGKQPLGCAHIGEVIGQLRAQAGMTLHELCRGLCVPSALHKIEKGVNLNPKDKVRGIKQPNFYLLEALFQRLGRDINLYYNNFLPKRNFDEKQMRDEIRALLATWKYGEAEALLNKLKLSKDYQKGVNRQFILSSEATVAANKEGYNEQYINLINEAIKITIPGFDARVIEEYRLTFDEIILINKMAIYAANNNNRPQAIRLLKQLISNIDKNIVDESEKVRTYITILYNYSKYLGLEKEYPEALTAIEDAAKLAISNLHMTLLPGLANNKAYSLFKMGLKKESLPYFAMAYYGAALMGKTENACYLNVYVKEHLGFEFD